MNRLSIQYDEELDILTVDGVSYTGDLFRQLGGLLPVGQVFRIVQRFAATPSQTVLAVSTIPEPVWEMQTGVRRGGGSL